MDQVIVAKLYFLIVLGIALVIVFTYFLVICYIILRRQKEVPEYNPIIKNEKLTDIYYHNA